MQPGASVIRLERLDLVLLEGAVLHELVQGRRDRAASLLGIEIPPWWPDEHDLRFLRFRLRQGEQDPQAREWLVRGVVFRDEGALAGHAGFHGPPGAHGLPPDAAEIGYAVFPPYRGRGFGIEAARGLVSFARQRGVRTIVASVSPTNEPSLAIVRKLGFRHVGEQWDEVDGLELVFHLDDELSSGASSSRSATTTSEPASPVEQ